jgi:hypothetical protein
VSRDGFEVPKAEPLKAAHARIDAFLDEIHRENPATYSTQLDITGFDGGQAMLKLPDKERSETAAAALMRYTKLRRNYRGGIYSPGDYTVNDYQCVVSRIAERLLRSKIAFEEALLVRMLGEVADYAAWNVRTYPVKSLLGQVEHFVKRTGALPDALRPPLNVIVDKLAEMAGSNEKPPKIFGEVSTRAKALLGPATSKQPAKPKKKPKKK